MAEFRKKPVVINAFQWTGNNSFRLGEWHQSVGRKEPFRIDDDNKLLIPTLEGVMTASPGDYIIRGIQGEFYPCKPDIFLQTYDAVGDEEGFTSQGIDFGHAIAAAKLGKRVARAGWNGKGMFVFLRPADALSVSMIVDVVKSLPQSVKNFFDQKYPLVPNTELPTGPGIRPEVKIQFGEYWCMYAADGSIVNGWLASQTDMLATDWTILD